MLLFQQIEEFAKAGREFSPAILNETIFLTTLFEDESEEANPLINIEVNAPLIGQRYAMMYADSEGRSQVRDITIRSYYQRDSEGQFYINAYCHGKKAARTFKQSKIISLIDPNTGEVFENVPEYLGKLHKVLPSAEPNFHTFISTIICELHLLAYLAACDGHYHDLEKEVLLEYSMARLGSIKLDMIQLEKYVARVMPDSMCFKAALLKAKQLPKEEKFRLLRYMNKMVNADGILRDEEFLTFLEFQNEIGGH